MVIRGSGLAFLRKSTQYIVAARDARTVKSVEVEVRLTDFIICRLTGIAVGGVGGAGGVSNSVILRSVVVVGAPSVVVVTVRRQ
jgi:hypothetical protein